MLSVSWQLFKWAGKRGYCGLRLPGRDVTTNPTCARSSGCGVNRGRHWERKKWGVHTETPPVRVGTPPPCPLWLSRLHYKPSFNLSGDYNTPLMRTIWNKLASSNSCNGCQNMVYFLPTAPHFSFCQDECLLGSVPWIIISNTCLPSFLNRWSVLKVHKGLLLCPMWEASDINAKLTASCHHQYPPPHLSKNAPQVSSGW